MQTLPEVTVYGAKDEETDKFIQDTFGDEAQAVYAVWEKYGAPDVRKMTVGTRAHYTPGTINLPESMQEFAGKIDGKLIEANIKELEANKPELDQDPKVRDSYYKKLKFLTDIKNLQENPLPDENKNTFVQELAHSAQFQESPVSGVLRAAKGLLREDSSHSEGRYGKPGEFEHEAHSVIAPQLFKEIGKYSPMGKKRYYIKPDRS